MRRFNRDITRKRSFVCPQCKKHRMIRPFDYEPSAELRKHKTYVGETVELHIDVCDFCVAKNKKKYFEPSRADLKRALKVIQDGSALEGGPSLEELL